MYRMEDFLREVFGIEVELNPKNEAGQYLGDGEKRLKALLETLGVEWAGLGCESPIGEPCSSPNRYEEGDHVFVPANPYGFTPPFIGRVVRVEQSLGKRSYVVADIKRNGVSDLIPCACHIRPLKDLGIILKEPIKAYWD